MSQREKFTPYNPEAELHAGIAGSGGFVNTHSHLDRAHTLTPENIHLAGLSLKQKWDAVDELKRESTVDDIFERMAYATEKMLAQGVQAIGSFIDVDDVIKDKAIIAADNLRDYYKNDIRFVFMNQSLKGVLDPVQQNWFFEGAAFVDIIGGLPGKDQGNEKEHIDLLLDTARSMGKMVHVHVDQFNDPTEAETELLVARTVAFGMQGKVAAIHGISIAAHSEEYRKGLYKKMKDADVSLITCPSAWIDSRRNEVLTPTHNSIAPVEEMMEAGIVVAIGTDNIRDIYKPFSSGDMNTELKFLLESLHYYNQQDLIHISSSNGLKVLGLDSSTNDRRD